MRSTATIFKSISATRQTSLSTAPTIHKRNISIMGGDYVGPFDDPFDPLNPINQVMIQNQKDKAKKKQEKKVEKKTPPKSEDNNTGQTLNDSRPKPGCDY